MNDFNQRSAFRCSICCVDHNRCFVDKNYCEILCTLKLFDLITPPPPFAVMLEKWLHHVKFDKYSATTAAASASSSAFNSFDLNASSQRHQQQVVHQSPNTNNFQMAHSKNVNFEPIERAFRIQSLNSIRSTHLFERCHRYAAWSGNTDSRNQCDHDNTIVISTDGKLNYRNECSSSSSNSSQNTEILIRAQESYTMPSKKLMNDNHNNKDNKSIAASKNRQTNTNDLVSGKCATTQWSPAPLPLPSPSTLTSASPQMPRSPAVSAKLSLKFVHRSPLSTIIHRANMLPIFIKYLLILNCFMCFVSGNLMARNIGNSNDLRNYSNPIDSSAPATATAAASSTSALHANETRRGMPTTMSPSILHSLISNNRSQLFQSASSQVQPSGGTTTTSSSAESQQRAKQMLQQHAQDLLTSGYVSDEPVSSFKVPNADDSGSEEFSRCASCQFREQLKAQNLQSIKMHILARLSMTHPPNITGRPHISEQILQTFYQNNDFRYIRIRNGSNGSGGGNPFLTDDMNEMQGDDPNASTGSQKHQHHMHGQEYRGHEYRGNSDGGDEGGAGGHHHHQSSYHHHRHTRYVM